MKLSKLLLLTIIAVLLTPLAVACSGASSKPQVELKLAPASALPDFVRSAPPQVQEAYRFAIANPDVLRNFPCYCGCGAVGHKNNLDCYIKEVRADGSIEFDNHAFG
ncbi:MAG: hypothetical protein D6784_10255 [Chloroflexi bacterium]|nr:MAG: hypothetical protein D6784_10255 [Chloroflexota bacterium]